MGNFYTIHAASKILGVTPQTLRNWDKTGKLKPHHTSANGYRYYSQEQIDAFLRVAKKAGRIVIGYCRVSSVKQRDDLKRQEEAVRAYLIAQGSPFEIITDIGSGINYSKPGLHALIERITRGDVKKVTVLYKDRLIQFGFEMIEYLAGLYNCEIEIIDNTPKTEQQEFVEDLVQIITVFSCKLHGKRANKARKIVKELVGDDTDD